MKEAIATENHRGESEKEESGECIRSCWSGVLGYLISPMKKPASTVRLWHVKS